MLDYAKRKYKGIDLSLKLYPSKKTQSRVIIMYIEELILDGFKSYATRTVISGWDREFNAITGLNGSGKSNILDAICFVLGITNLSQVGSVSYLRFGQALFMT